MSEEELELLITLDDPGEDAQEEDTFNHLLQSIPKLLAGCGVLYLVLVFKRETSMCV
jgi:hypothetical protein